MFSSPPLSTDGTRLCCAAPRAAPATTFVGAATRSDFAPIAFEIGPFRNSATGHPSAASIANRPCFSSASL
eukprot:1957524-Rhodomonas_salina.1